MCEVSLDYCFIRRHDEDAAQTMLRVKDRASRAIMAWMLRRKGVDEEEPAQLAAQALRNLGYENCKVWLKIDNE